MVATKSKRVYILKWTEYISPLYNLSMTHDRKLSQQVIRTLKKLEQLVKRIAKNKGLK